MVSLFVAGSKVSSSSSFSPVVPNPALSRQSSIHSLGQEEPSLNTAAFPPPSRTKHMTMTQPTATHQARAQDVDLTASALEHRIAEANGKFNGHTNGANGANGHTVKALDASKLTVQLADPTAREVPDEATANAGDETTCTDHMITCKWRAATGWETPELKPYGPLSLMPTASVLHYATECFEGLKVFRGYDGKLRLFRLDLNARRMLMSTLRISLPGFEPEELEKLITTLVAVDGPKWLPRERPGSFLYIRPAMIGTQSQLGVQAPKEALLFITVSFMPRLDAPVGGIKLHTNPEDMVRAWVGGFGYAKVGANYGPSLLATAEARARGFGQILWLYGPEGYCTEAGASNFFIVWRAKESEGGQLQLVTAPLDDKLILDGVTRRSVVELARKRLRGEVEMVERKYTIDEVVEADREGRIVEAFAAGTAYFICAVSMIHHRGKDVQIPMGKTGEIGPLTAKLKGWMMDIMYGNEQHEWGVVVSKE